MKKKKVQIKQIIISWTVLIGLVLAAVVYYGEKNINPMLESVITNAGKTYATNAVNDAVCDILNSGRYKSDDIINITYNSNGDVKSINCDCLKINLLKSDITLEAQKRISEKENIPVKVHIGMLSGSELFKNCGPEISIDTYITGGVVTDFETKFTDAGVNQSLFTLSAVITGDISVYSSTLKADTSVNTSVIVAQTVVVGTVPDLIWNNEL